VGDRHVTPERVLKSNLRLLYGNNQEISELRNFRRCESAGAALSVNVLKIKRAIKIAAAEEKNPRVVLSTIPLLILYFFSGSPTRINGLRPRETAVGFLFRNILTVETSLWGLRSIR
jgi:hypothetical protein